MGIAFVAACRRVAPEAFGWRTEPYEFVADPIAIDLLAGHPRLREGVEAGADTAELMADFELPGDYLERRAPFLLYDEGWSGLRTCAATPQEWPPCEILLVIG